MAKFDNLSREFKVWVAKAEGEPLSPDMFSGAIGPDDLELCKQMRIRDVGLLMQEITQDPAFDHWSTVEVFRYVIWTVMRRRHVASVGKLTQRARLHDPGAHLSRVWTDRPQVTAHLLDRWKHLVWYHQGNNIVLLGPTGAGKSFIAQALAVAVAELGDKPLYCSVVRLGQDLMGLSPRDQAYQQLRLDMASADVLVLDDIGLVGVPSEVGNFLFDVIAQRDSVRSTVFTSQVKVEGWGHQLGLNSAQAQALGRRVLGVGAELVEILPSAGQGQRGGGKGGEAVS